MADLFILILPGLLDGLSPVRMAVAGLFLLFLFLPFSGRASRHWFSFNYSAYNIFFAMLVLLLGDLPFLNPPWLHAFAVAYYLFIGVVLLLAGAGFLFDWYRMLRGDGRRPFISDILKRVPAVPLVWTVVIIMAVGLSFIAGNRIWPPNYFVSLSLNNLVYPGLRWFVLGQLFIYSMALSAWLFLVWFMFAQMSGEHFLARTFVRHKSLVRVILAAVYFAIGASLLYLLAARI
jgi:hypothetical protein